jgi:ankyrin repeat protein
MFNKSLFRSKITTLILLIVSLLLTNEVLAQSRLYNAVIDDNKSKASRFLTRGDDPNGDGNPQYIPLIGAAEKNLYSMILLLNSHKADLNIQNHIGFTALLEATIQGNNRIMGYLIKEGADLELKANNGATALMVAVNAQNTRGARILLEAGANANTSDAKGITPLMKTMEVGDNVELVNLLVEHGADMNARNPEGKPVLLIYSYRNRIPAHQELIKLGADVNIQDKEGKTPLIKAVMEGNLDMVKILIENGADRFITDNSGTSANDYGYVQMEIRQYFETLEQ